MRRHDRHASSGLDLFWEEADLTGSAEHPLERELAHRLDTLMRYERMLADAQSAGLEDALELLSEQYLDQLGFIERLERALGGVWFDDA